jgi:hypothetical protein
MLGQDEQHPRGLERTVTHIPRLSLIWEDRPAERFERGWTRVGH